MRNYRLYINFTVAYSVSFHPTHQTWKQQQRQQLPRRSLLD